MQSENVDHGALAEVASGYKRFQNGDVIFCKDYTMLGKRKLRGGQRPAAAMVGFGSTEFYAYIARSACLSIHDSCTISF